MIHSPFVEDMPARHVIRGAHASAFFSTTDMLPKAHWHRTTHHDRSAFTLIELLVVLSIITLLAAMLLPLARLRAGAGETQRVRLPECGKWAVAFDCYAAENNGFYPHCDGTDRGPRALDDPRISNADLADWHGWVDLLPPMIDLPAWRDYRRWDKPKEDTFFQCPSGIPFEISGLYSYRPEREGYFSYAMNSCLELDANAWPPADGRGYPMPSFLDTARIHTPSRVFILFDQLLDPRKGFDENKLYRGAGKHLRQLSEVVQRSPP